MNKKSNIIDNKNIMNISNNNKINHFKSKNLFKKTFIFLTFFLLTGCYDHKELNEIAILTATEITKVNNEFIVDAQVVNPQSKDTITKQAPFFIYQGKGKTLQEAYRQIKLQSSRFLYPNHLQILIVNEKLAKEDINEIIDFFLRTPHIRSEFNILVGKSENILNTVTPIDEISASSILSTMETNNKYLGMTNIVSFNEFTNMSIDDNLEVILPSIEVVDYSEEAQNIENTENTFIEKMYKLAPLAIFKEKKLLGYLTEDESITYNVIKGKTKTNLITYECEKNKYMTLEITNIKPDIKVKKDKIEIKIDLAGNVNETMCNIKLDNEKNIEKLQKKIEKYYKEKTEKDINNIRKNYNSDIFGFLDLLYKTDYESYKEIKKDWYKDIYQNIEIKVTPKIRIIGKGNVLEGNNEEN